MNRRNFFGKLLALIGLGAVVSTPVRKPLLLFGYPVFVEGKQLFEEEGGFQILHKDLAGDGDYYVLGDDWRKGIQ